MSGKQFRVDFISLHILHHASEEPVYGLWMIEELARHGYRLSPSQLYPRFHALEQVGFLTRRKRIVGGRQRKYYRITPRGRTYLEQQKRRLLELAGEALPLEEIRELLERRREGHKSSGRS